jgi:hypothetical protein
MLNSAVVTWSTAPPRVAHRAAAVSPPQSTASGFRSQTGKRAAMTASDPDDSDSRAEGVNFAPLGDQTHARGGYTLPSSVEGKSRRFADGT